MSTNVNDTQYLTNAGITRGDENGNMDMPPKSKAVVKTSDIKENDNNIAKKVKAHLSIVEGGVKLGRIEIGDNGEITVLTGNISPKQMEDIRAMLKAEKEMLHGNSNKSGEIEIAE